MLRVMCICAVGGFALFGLVGSLTGASTATTSASVVAPLATSANTHGKVRSDAVTRLERERRQGRASLPASLPPTTRSTNRVCTR